MTGTNSSSKSESLSAVETDGKLSLTAASVPTDFDAMLSFGNAMSLFEADILELRGCGWRCFIRFLPFAMQGLI